MTTPGNTRTDIACLIDHTLLRPDTTLPQIRRLCDEAIEFGFATVCVNPCFTETCVRLLNGTGVQVCTVVGFPFGCSMGEVKVFEGEMALRQGARELDMMINIGMLKEDRTGRTVDLITSEIHGMVAAAQRYRAIVKVILETGLLTQEQKFDACQAAKAAGAHFVKTSTGFLGGGATVEDVALLRKNVGPGMGVKASGGIRTLHQSRAMLAAGANRIGTSAGVAIVREEQSQRTG